MNQQFLSTQIFLIGMPGGSEWIFIFIFFIPLYFLPSIIARNGDSFIGVFLVNLFLGWTLLGWIASLIWAFTSTKKRIPIIINNNISETKTGEFQHDKLNQLQQLKILLDNGVLTQEEFMQQKSEILSSKITHN